MTSRRLFNLLALLLVLPCLHACDDAPQVPSTQPQSSRHNDLHVSTMHAVPVKGGMLVALDGTTLEAALKAAESGSDGQEAVKNIVDILVLTPDGRGAVGFRGGTGAPPWLYSETLSLDAGSGWKDDRGGTDVTINFDGRDRVVQVGNSKLKVDDGALMIVKLDRNGGIGMSQTKADLDHPDLKPEVREELRKRFPARYGPR